MTAYSIPIVLICGGLLLAGASSTLPAYSDPNWEQEFLGVNVTLENSKELSNRWYAAKASVQTPKHQIDDFSMGLVGLGLSMASLFRLKRVRSWADLRRIATPGSRRDFLVAATLAWCSLVPAQWAALSFDLARGDFPWWSDAIAIPASGALMIGVVGLPIVLAGVEITLWNSELPRSLWSRPIVRKPRLISAGLCVLSVLSLVLLEAAVRGDPFSVPSFFAVSYLLLSGRAACGARGSHDQAIRPEVP